MLLNLSHFCPSLEIISSHFLEARELPKVYP